MEPFSQTARDHTALLRVANCPISPLARGKARCGISGVTLHTFCRPALGAYPAIVASDGHDHCRPQRLLLAFVGAIASLSVCVLRRRRIPVCHPTPPPLDEINKMEL